MDTDRNTTMQSTDLIEELLLKQFQDLEQRLSSIVTEEKSLYQDADLHEIAFFQEEIQPINLINKDQTLKKLNEIKRSLAKLSNGSYGICDRCGDEIDQERLRILVTASLCRRCK